jgi:hypothetical protein
MNYPDFSVFDLSIALAEIVLVFDFSVFVKQFVRPKRNKKKKSTRPLGKKFTHRPAPVSFTPPSR